jgi:elongation factor Ts
MATISASAVMELRKKMGVSMMECKKALVEAEGDEAKAIELLRQKGAAKADKKSDRETNEGAVIISGNAYAKVLCETDFVARNDDFVAFVTELAKTTAEKGEDAAKEYFESVKADKMAQLGENLVFDACGVVEGDIVSGYVHSNKKIATLVALKGGSEDLARDLGMHIVGMSPTVITWKDVDAQVANKETESRIAAVKEENIERERLGKPLKNIPQFISQSQITDEILANIETQIKEELAAEGKPEKIWDKILPGKIQRFIADNTALDRELALLSQDFVKDTSKTVEQVLTEAGAEVTNFIRVEV